MRRRLTRADAFTEILRAVNASLEPERVADAMIAGLADWIPVSGWLVLASDEGGARRIAAPGLPPALEPAAQAVGEFVLGGAGVFCSADVSADPRLPRIEPATPGGRDRLAARVPGPAVGRAGRDRSGAVGPGAAVRGGEPERAPRGTWNLGPLRSITRLRIERAEALSVTDDLTQLYNSRYLSQVLRRETKRASRSGRPLSLLFIDLDGFKGVNDRHGHLAGSAALVEAAAVIRISARETDIVARFGGDEFALVLPETGSEGAEMVGARIRDKIAAHPFLRKDGLDIKLSVSVGVATLPDVATTAEQLVKAADEAMYWVKEHGKNNVHVAHPTDENAQSAMNAKTVKTAGRDWTFG